MSLPDLSLERVAQANGARIIAGVDEVGRGPLAGPVVAAAVVLSTEAPEGLNDSKRVSPRERERLAQAILASCTVAVASVAAGAVDRLNVRAASLLAMRLALLGLPQLPDHALIDGNALPDRLPCTAEAIVKGDTRSRSIAAASLVAKVMRDRTMVRADGLWPGYGFASHKGYGVPVHRTALVRSGPCPLHRLSFAPLNSV